MSERVIRARMKYVNPTVRLVHSVKTQFSTIIVGGGIVGVSIAHFLAQAGESDILLLEGDELASGSTGGSLGGVRQQFSTPEQVEIALRGHQFWSTFESTYGSPCGWNQEGYLFLTGSHERLERLSSAADVQRKCGATQVEILDTDGLSDLLPWLGTDGLVGGCWTPLDGRVNPTDGVYVLARLARRAGVEIRQREPAVDFEHIGDTWTVHTETGSFTAPRVIVAAGFKTPALLSKFKMDLEIGFTRRHVGITGPVLEGQRLPLTIDLDTGFCVEREHDGAAVMVVNEIFSMDDSPHDMLAEFAELAEVRAPDFADVSIRSTYTAFPDKNGGDGHPYIGEVEQGLWVAAGFDGHGTMQGPAFAQLLAEHLSGRPDPSINLGVFDPWRPSGERTEWLSARRKGQA